MEITVKGAPKEIAALLSEVTGRPETIDLSGLATVLETAKLDLESSCRQGIEKLLSHRSEQRR